MQNNVTELTNRLLRALDNNYNVIDMPAVIEIVSLLEKVTITKELLETTRLGKHVNELRRKTDNDSLSKRAKELVKKWRNMVLPSDSSSNGIEVAAKKRPLLQSASNKSSPDNSKRAKVNGTTTTSELDMSDTSNSSFKDVINAKLTPKFKPDVILINSDSNSSFPDVVKIEQTTDVQVPKKRGRKKGSKNHKNLIDEAETSFTNKLAVSRGNSKVKTTQELIAGLQNKNNQHAGTSPVKSKEDLSMKAAKLTERVSEIDQKLNTNANRYKNASKKMGQTKICLGGGSEKVIESGSVINDKSLLAVKESEEDVIVVDDLEGQEMKEEEFAAKVEELDGTEVKSLSVEEALAQLPAIDKSCLFQGEDGERCTCMLREYEEEEEAKVEENGGGEEVSVVVVKKYEFVEDGECAAAQCLRQKESKLTVEDLHWRYLENVNGNWGIKSEEEGGDVDELKNGGLYVNVVPNVNNEHIPKDVKCEFACENFQKYNISEDQQVERRSGEEVDGMKDNNNDKLEVSDRNEEEVAKVDGGGVEGKEEDEEGGENRTDNLINNNNNSSDNRKVFCEWHQVLDKPSYNGDILKILPYVIID